MNLAEASSIVSEGKRRSFSIPYSRLFYHLIWATKDRETLIDDLRERVIEASIRRTCSEMNLPLHAIGIVRDHVHIVISIPPSLAIADVVARFKGASSRRASLAETEAPPFKWQAEYGVLSLTAKALPEVVSYVEHQKNHHESLSLITGMEIFE